MSVVSRAPAVASSPCQCPPARLISQLSGCSVASTTFSTLLGASVRVISQTQCPPRNLGYASPTQRVSCAVLCCPGRPVSECCSQVAHVAAISLPYTVDWARSMCRHADGTASKSKHSARSFSLCQISARHPFSGMLGPLRLASETWSLPPNVNTKQ